jgi:hypothetical protein
VKGYAGQGGGIILGFNTETFSNPEIRQNSLNLNFSWGGVGYFAA